MPATLIDSQVKPQFFSLTWFPEAKILLVRGQLIDPVEATRLEQLLLAAKDIFPLEGKE